MHKLRSPLTTLTLITMALCLHTTPATPQVGRTVPGEPQVQATPATPAKPPLQAAKTPAERAAARKAMLEHFGGFLDLPATGPKITIYSAQKRYSNDKVTAVVNQMGRNLMLGFNFVPNQEGSGMQLATTAMTSTNVAAAIVIVDEPHTPSLLTAPEARWTIVNVAPLAADNPTPETFDLRVSRQLWRALGYAMGAANSNFHTCVMKPISQPSDLDALQAQVMCPEPYSKIVKQAEELGMTRQRKVPYRKACEEGWAPPPTNDLQKAVWQELNTK